MTNHTQIFTSIKQNSVRQVTLLLQGGCDVNATNRSGQTPLIASLVHVYDAEARSKIVTQLLRAGADVNRADKNRRCPLTYACVLNQADTIAILLKQPTINPNLADYNGVTPLMLAARQGNTQAVRVMMEAQASGSVTIDLSARDDNGQSAFGHAMEAASNDSRRSGEAGLASNCVEITRLLASCGGADFPAGGPGAEVPKERQRPLTPTAPDETVGDFEMVDMRKSSPRRDVSGTKVRAPEGTATRLTAPVAGEKEPGSGEDTARQWAENLKQEHEAAGRLSALVSPAPCSRPGSRQGASGGGGGGIPLKDKHPPPCKSSLGVGSGRSLRPGSGAKLSAQHRPTSRLRASSVETEDDDDEEDISLESLTELLGTVRQYAREIHEIYAPIQKDEEERTRKKRERLARKKSRELEKSLVAPLAPPAPSQQHEVRVEIHAIEDQLKSRVQGRPRPHGPAHSKSTDPTWPGGAPLAMLTVEDEQLLSSTWPRGRLRPKSRERFWTETAAAGQGRGQDVVGAGGGAGGHSSVSYPCSPTASFNVSNRPGGRPHLSSGDPAPRLGGLHGRHGEDPQGASIQHERDILNKAFQKMQKPVPILKSFNKNTEVPAASSSNKADRRLKEQVITSRQSVIQVARQHQQNRQAANVHQQQQQQQEQQQQAVPSISIIGPGEGSRDVGQGRRQQGKDGGAALPSAGSHDVMFQYLPSSPTTETALPQDAMIPRADVISGDTTHDSGEGIGQGHAAAAARRSKDGGAGVKSSGKPAGLRHRKSVDKGLGNGIASQLEKY